MKILTLEEIEQLLVAHQNADVRDFITSDADGKETIDIDKIKGAKFCTIQSFTSVNGKLVEIELSNGQKAKLNGFVYLIQAENGLVKIGFTDNLMRRFSALNSNSPVELKVIACIETATPEYLESRLHKRYASKRIRGEWFALSAEDIQEIVTTGEALYRDNDGGA